jgi:hypothetical protein
LLLTGSFPPRPKPSFRALYAISVEAKTDSVAGKGQETELLRR